MKKIFLFVLGLACTLLAQAQMMPDSTVQVVAWWDVGDKADYTYAERKYETDAKGNEVQTQSTSETWHIEVIAATDTTYTLRLTSDDLFSSEIDLSLTPEQKDVLKRDIPVVFSTDENGTFLGIDNMDEVAQAYEAVIPVLAEAAYMKMDASARRSTGPKTIENYLRGIYSRETVYATLVQQITPLFAFHGGRYDMDRVYSMETSTSGVIGDVEIPVTTSFRYMPDYSDSTAAVMYMVTKADREALVPAMKQMIFNIMRQTNPELGPADFKAFEAGFDSVGLDASYEDKVVESIHLATGWPIEWSFERNVTAVQGDNVRTTRVEKEILYVFEE